MARWILQSLGESGQPPKLGALKVNVGTDPILKRLRADYLEGHCASVDGMDGGGTCKWVEADYGNGKTQFLRCVQETAWELNYVTAFVELSQDECPLDRPERIYGAVARSLQAKPLTPSDVDKSKGLDVVLCQLFDRMFPGVLTGAGDPQQKALGAEWVSSLRNVPVESTAFGAAAAGLLAARLGGDDDKARVATLYLRGEPVPTGALKVLGVYEKLDKSSGFRLLRSMCQLLQRSGLAAGTVLLFDEARRSLSLMSSKAQKYACENLLNVINRCNSGELPGTVFLYAVMPEFFTNFAENYPALQQRCGPSTRYRLDSLANIEESDLLRQIGERITEVFAIAHEDAPKDKRQLKGNLRLVVVAAMRQRYGTGTRRLLVKGWVEVLRGMREGRIGDLTEDKVEGLLVGVSEELGQAETAAVDAEGE